MVSNEDETSQSVRCPACEGYHPQGGFAMAKLCERLVREGYVRDDRKAELLERAKNMQAGRGFVTDKVLAEREAYEKKQAAEKPPEPQPETPDLSDFLQ